MDTAFNFRQNDFPNQRIPSSEKDKTWAMRCCDFVIAAGLQCNDRTKTEQLLEILHGDIPDEFYSKTLNPYNASKKQYTYFPATMRNLDIINDIVRRYVSEYVSEVHEFIVGANNPEVVLARDNAIKQDILKRAILAYQQELQRRIQEQEQQNAELEAQGQQTNPIDPAQLMQDAEEFEKEFVDNYIDEISTQAQHLLDALDDVLDNDTIIPQAYFNWVVTGECYSYHSVKGKTLIKEIVPTTEMYPVPNGKQKVEDYDMVARRTHISYAQLLEMFEEEIDEKDLEFIKTYYNPSTMSNNAKYLTLNQYTYYFPEKCKEMGDEDRRLFANNPVNIQSLNGNLIELWHAVWRGYAMRGILTYINEAGFVETRVVDEDYEFNIDNGDISIEWKYEEQIYESYRIGDNKNGIYPIKARPIAFQREPECKLPYCGLQEILPQMGRFSIVEVLVPFQVLINIFSYHREMMIAKNKMFILLMGKSLMGGNPEDTIYRMAAEGILLYDDSEDSNSLKAQQIRMLNANINGYIQEISQLIEDIKTTARDMVDMTPQRYGEIAQSAGKGVTDEAIIRGSMGSVIITYMFNKFRESDYAADLDNSKFAWIEGLDTSYFDSSNKRRYLSLDVNSHVFGRYIIKAKNNQKISQQLQQLQNWAFSAAQNGDLDMALAAITEGNITAIEAKIAKFRELKQKNEETLRQLDMELEDKKNQNILEQIAAKGQQDRLTEEVKQYYQLQAKGIDIATTLNDNNSLPSQVDMEKNQIEREKIAASKEQAQLGFINSSLDRAQRDRSDASKERIAAKNKNRYDK